MIEEVFEQDAKKAETIVIDLTDLYAKGYDEASYTQSHKDSLLMGVPQLKEPLMPNSKDKS